MKNSKPIHSLLLAALSLALSARLAAEVPTAIVNAVPESGEYELIYQLEIPEMAPDADWVANIPYDVDATSTSSTKTFDRVAYVMELDNEWVWVSFNTIAPTPDLLAGKVGLKSIGVPTAAVVAGTPIQTRVNDMNVFSSLPSAFLTAGTGLTGGNIEFWPGNYGGPNAIGIPNASDDTFDFGDGGASPSLGYGSMQVHNHEAQEVIFAFNRWGGVFTGAAVDVGIGSFDGGNPDYTFAGNGSEFVVRNLYILVRPGLKDSDSDGIPDTIEGLHGLNPQVADSSSDTDGDGLTALQELMETSTDPNNGDSDGDGLSDKVETNTGVYVSVTNTGTDPNNPDTDGDSLLDASEVPGGDPGTSPLVADTDGDFISDDKELADGTDPLVAGAIATIPASIGGSVPESGDYRLIYQLAIPAQNEWAGDASAVSYDVNGSQSGIQFDRVAYVMELDHEWVWVSFDTFASSLSEVGIPFRSVQPEPVAQNVDNMNIYSNVNDKWRLETGEGLSGGNIEFWCGNYAPPNALEVPFASDETFDFGDTMTPGGHGSMQVHNHEAEQVVFAYNNWGSNNPGTAGGLGIGTSEGANPDWTFDGNSADYAKRNLYILVRGVEAASTNMNVSLSGNTITLTWEGSGVLETATSVLGPWKAVDGASSGYTAQTTQSEAYYRVR